MSRKNQFISELVEAERKLGGSHVTHQEREKHLRLFARTVHRLGYTQIKEVKDISEKHIRAYIEERTNQGISRRTLQNHMSAIRSVLTVTGKGNFAKSERISNHTLGISGASRAGTKEAIPTEVLELATSKIRDEGVRAALGLMRELGLRDEEAIRSVESLKTWESRLMCGSTISVVIGTKGGRPRDVEVLDVSKALAVIKAAQTIVQQQNGRLINRPTLKQAKSTLSSKCSTAGLIGKHAPHSLRYAYAQDLEKKYLEKGYSFYEAQALTSLSLGHGDGRGRYVARVYCRNTGSS